jgi:hypothetical protein
MNNNTIKKKRYTMPPTSRPCMIAMAKHNVKYKIENKYNIKEDKCFVGGCPKETIKLKKTK